MKCMKLTFKLTMKLTIKLAMESDIRTHSTVEPNIQAAGDPTKQSDGLTQESFGNKKQKNVHEAMQNMS